MKKSTKQPKRLSISTATANSLVLMFVRSALMHSIRFDDAKRRIKWFLEESKIDFGITPEDTIHMLQEPIINVNFAKDILAIEALLKRSKIHIPEEKMDIIDIHLTVYKKYLTEIWPKHKTHLEKLLKQAYKDYRSQRSSDN